MYNKDNFPVYFLCFDETYFNQRNLIKLGKIIDLRALTQVKYLCSYDKLEEIGKVVSSEKGIKFLGKSDFHYLTYLFVRNIKANFNFIVIDHHVDFKNTFNGYISCGSWLRDVLKLPLVEKIFLITSDNNTTEVPNKLIIVNKFSILEDIIKRLPIYISIDKDILGKEYLNTNWEQGNMDLDEFLNLLNFLSHFNVIGVDVCGEPDFNLAEYKKSEQLNLMIYNIFAKNISLKISA